MNKKTGFRMSLEIILCPLVILFMFVYGYDLVNANAAGNVLIAVASGSILFYLVMSIFAYWNGEYHIYTSEGKR